MKKKIFIMICILLTVAATIVGVFKYHSAQKEQQYLTTAVPYLKQVIPELSKWDPQIAKSYMSQEFMQKISAERFAQVLKALSKVGTLQSLGEPHFEEIYSGTRQTIISYTIQATYSTGDAEIMMGLLDRDGQLEVYRFNVQSEALAE